MLQTYQKQAKVKLIATLVTLVVIAGVIVLVNHLKVKPAAAPTAAVSSNTTASSATTAPAKSSTNTPSATTAPATTSSGYKDGTFSAANDYFVPSGDQSIKVTATLSNGTITDVSVVNSEGDPTSSEYQQSFASEYKSYVVGQKISGLRLSVIGGASDTTQAFSNDLRQIADKAQA